MNPARRLLLACAALLLLTMAGTLGYVVIAGMAPIDALFMTVITLSTVGYREMAPLDTTGKAFTIVLIVVGVGTTFYALIVLAETLIEGRLRDVIGRRSMKRAIGAMLDHVVLCGYGRFGGVVAKELEQRGVAFVAIESDPGRRPELEESGHPYVIGTALDDDELAEAGIARPRAIVIATGSDADNVFIALSAREANPRIAIHARGESEAGIRRLQLAGATQVISPYHLGGQRIAYALAQPSVVDFVTLAAPAGAPSDISLEEVVIGPGSAIATTRLRELPGRGLQLHVVALKRKGEPTRFQPQGDDALRVGDRVVVVGDAENLRRIAELAEGG